MQLERHELAILERAGLSPIDDHEKVGHWLAVLRLVPILKSRSSDANLQSPLNVLRCFALSDAHILHAFLIDGIILGWDGITWTSSSKL